MRNSVKIINGALDEWNGNIVVRGIVDPDSMDLLLVSDYQREVLPSSTIESLVKALEDGGRFPDIELGLRGGSFREKDGNVYLSDDVHIIDGLQRISAGKAFMKKGGENVPHIGAMVHFNTTEQWERERFRILNQDRTKLSPNILIRNLRHDLKAVEMLYNLSHDTDFVMRNKICWTQGMSRGQLITARTFCEVAALLHSHISPSGERSNITDLTKNIQRTMDIVGRNTMRKNLEDFFDIIDQCWGIKTIAYKEGATWLRSTFLACLTEVFSMHQDFWKEGRFVVESNLIRKIKLFEVQDPYVKELSGARGQAIKLLRGLMIEHINSGKRTRRLKPWKQSEAEVADSDPAEHDVGGENTGG